MGLILFSSCIGEMPLTIYIDQQSTAPAEKKSVVPVPFNYTIDLYGADNTRGVARFTQKQHDEMIILNIYAHDLPADHLYNLQYAIDTLSNGKCVAGNWVNLSNGSIEFDMEADRAGAIIEEYKFPASIILTGRSFDIRFQLKDHTSEVALTSNCHTYRLQ